MSFNLLIICHIFFNCAVLLATVYLIRSLNRSRTRDYVYCHLVCISLCIIVKEVVDCIGLCYLLLDPLSDTPKIIEGIHKVSFLLPLLYLALGSIAFLLCANFVYSKDDEHADGMCTKTLFIAFISASAMLSVIYTTGNDELMRIILIIIIASWALTGLTVLGMSTRFILHHSSDPLAKRQFFLCILFVLVTLLIHVSGLTWALVTFAEATERSARFSTGTMGVKVMFEMYPMISLTLAFSFFPSVRHGLRLIFHPPPSPLNHFPSPAESPLPYHLAVSNTFPSINRIAPKSSLPQSVSSIQSIPPPPYSNLQSLHIHETATHCPSCAPPLYNNPAPIYPSVYPEAQAVICHEEAPAYRPYDIRLPGQVETPRSRERF